MYHLLAATLIAALGSSQVAAAPTKPASCATNHGQAAHLVQAAPVDYPESFKMVAASTKALIRVDLSATGRVLNTSVAKSTGSVILDRAAIAAVASSVYSPATDACSGVAGSYAVEVDLDN